MNDKYIIYYKTKNGDIVILVARYKKKTGMLDLPSLKKLFSILFKNQNYLYTSTLITHDSIHGNVYKVNLNKRETAEAFSITKRNSFNFEGARIKFLEMVITKNKIKELTENEFISKEASLIYFIELMRARLNSFGYNKVI